MSPISLPGSLFDTYKCYKNGTTTFIRWLTAQEQEHDEGAPLRAYVKSVDELKLLANSVLSKRKKLPTSLSWGLRDTIYARTRVSKFFKSLAGPGDREITSSHEHFTRTLLQIYHDFQGLAKVARPPPSSEKSLKRPSNVFEFLGFDDCVSSEDDQPVLKDHRNHSRRVFACGCVEECCSNDSTVPGNDNIGEFMALAMYLSQLDNLMAVVRDAWKKAAHGAMPTVVAATTTTMAYRAAQSLETDLAEYDIYNPEQFLARYTTCLRTLNLSGSSSKGTKLPLELTPFRDRKGPQQGWSALVKFRKFWRTEGSFTCLQAIDNCGECPDGPSCSFPWDDPMQFIVKKPCCKGDEEKQLQLDRVCLELVLKRMGQLLTIKESVPEIETPFDTPLLQDLCCFLESSKNVSCHGAVHPLSLSFGLEMLVQSIKSYLHPPGSDLDKEGKGSGDKEPLPSTRPSSCRLQSLKFALDVAGSITHLMKTPNAPCGCLKIGSSGIANLLLTSQATISDFIDTRRFDIFYQAPWVSGQHMVDNLARASDFGAKAWHHAYYVGTTLHIYHTLLKLEVINPTDFPLIEKLCNIFESAVFLGHRPTRNFLSCYQRWSGGCVSFPKGRCSGMHSHSHTGGMGKKWSLKYVKDVSQGGNHPNRGFHPSKISLFSLLVKRNFSLDDDVLVWTYCSKCNRIMKKDIHAARSRRDSVSFAAQSVEAVQEKLLDEFQGDFPVARMNYFRIYELCVAILQRIHEAEHPKQDPGHICSCVSGRLLSAADQYVDDMRVFKAFLDRRLIETCKQGFQSALKDKSFNDYLWNP